MSDHIPASHPRAESLRVRQKVIEGLEKKVVTKGPSDYPDNPVGYAENILKFKHLTGPQKAILQALQI
nr:hypothetical protein [Candidatus Sigynarchaeota archaeon]